MTSLPSYLTSHHLDFVFCMYRVMVHPVADLDSLFLMPCIFCKSAYPVSLALKQSATQWQQVQERLASLSSICIIHLVQILSFLVNLKIVCTLLPHHVKTWLLLVILICTLIPIHTVLKCFTIFVLLLIYNNLYPSPLIFMVILSTFWFIFSPSCTLLAFFSLKVFSMS